MMTNGDKHQENTAKIRWGAHFKATREGMHLSEKDAASRLHLNPSMITIIETEAFTNDTPVIFMRGYVRSYGRLLNISDKHINQALLDLGLVDQSTLKATPLRHKKVMETSNNNQFTRWSTSFVVLVLLGLVGMWWNTHTHNAPDTTTNSTLTMQNTNPANVVNPNTPPADPTPKELANTQIPAENPAPTVAAAPASAATAEDNTALTGEEPKTAANTTTTAEETNTPVTTAATQPESQPTNPINVGGGPNFDMNDTSENSVAAGMLDPETKPVKKHMAKIHHKSQDFGDNMAIPEPGLVPEPGDLDPNETN
jgi:cytoskeleton protein RodZ